MADPVEDDWSPVLRSRAEMCGTTFLGPELVSKRLQLLREIVPGLSRVAVLWHPRAYGERTMAGMLKEIESAAQTLGINFNLCRRPARRSHRRILRDERDEPTHLLFSPVRCYLANTHAS